MFGVCMQLECIISGHCNGKICLLFRRPFVSLFPQLFLGFIPQSSIFYLLLSAHFFRSLCWDSDIHLDSYYNLLIIWQLSIQLLSLFTLLVLALFVISN